MQSSLDLFLLGTSMVFSDLVANRDSTNCLIMMNDILVTSKRVSEEAGIGLRNSILYHSDLMK